MSWSADVQQTAIGHVEEELRASGARCEIDKGMPVDVCSDGAEDSSYNQERSNNREHCSRPVVPVVPDSEEEASPELIECNVCCETHPAADFVQCGIDACSFKTCLSCVCRLSNTMMCDVNECGKIHWKCPQCATVGSFSLGRAQNNAVALWSLLTRSRVRVHTLSEAATLASAAAANECEAAAAGALSLMHVQSLALEEDQLQDGDLVRVSGLVSSIGQRANGCIGTVDHFDSDRARYVVVVYLKQQGGDIITNGKRMKLKRNNLSRVPTAQEQEQKRRRLVDSADQFLEVCNNIWDEAEEPLPGPIWANYHHLPSLGKTYLHRRCRMKLLIVDGGREVECVLVSAAKSEADASKPYLMSVNFATGCAAGPVCRLTDDTPPAELQGKLVLVQRGEGAFTDIAARYAAHACSCSSVHSRTRLSPCT